MVRRVQLHGAMANSGAGVRAERMRWTAETQGCIALWVRGGAHRRGILSSRRRGIRASGLRVRLRLLLLVLRLLLLLVLRLRLLVRRRWLLVLLLRRALWVTGRHDLRLRQ